MPAAVHALVFDRLSKAGTNQTVSRRGEHIISEPEFRARVRAWRDALATLTSRDVALFEPDGAEFAAALVGALYAGKTVYLPGDTQADTCHALSALNVSFAGALPGGVVAKHDHHESESVLPFAALDADDCTLVIFTSGSTGAPQAVPKRLSQLLAEVHTLESVFGERLEHCEIVATVSHQHIYGLLFKILWPLVYGRPFVSASLAYPEQLANMFGAGKLAVISGPAHLKRLPESLNWTAAHHNLCAIFSSGGPLPSDSAANVEQLLGQAPVEVYGSSETGGVAWRQCTRGVPAPWTPLPGVEVAAHDSQLAVRSPHLPDHEWFRVPDHATFDEFGNFTLQGRADRIAKIEGKRVSLAGIEAVLVSTGLAAEARVVQLNAVRDELGAIVVLNSAGWDVLRAAQTRGLRTRLNAALVSSVERLAHPRRWRWVDALPVNATGKVSNTAALELFAEYGLALPAVHEVQASGSDVALELYVSPHLAVFDGHFRELPVLAGVVQVDWAILLARRYFAMPRTFLRMEAIKFLRVYQPGPMLRLSMQWNPDRNLLNFRFESENGTHSSGRIFFGA